MSALLPGFAYDIFISYRQKDNKGDLWVTHFVEALKVELESTFKDEVSVYFDAHPHEGLQEYHDVDASLQEKLKCLIFIPILSRTYCDQRSFAFEQEFKAFVQQASEDQWGLKVKLPDGHVAHRVLPVCIHALDKDDIATFENVLGGYLRPIEFIYRSVGVNRPLQDYEPHPQGNLNKSFYRDQVNKVAMAVKEIITAIQNNKNQPIPAENPPLNSVPKKKIIGRYLIPALLLFIAVIAAYFVVPKVIQKNKSLKLADKSIAVLPFKNSDPSNQYLAEGMMDEINNHLAQLSALRVVPRTSVEQFREKPKPAPEIAKLLEVNYLLDGSAQKINDRIKVTIQLIDALNDRQIWSETIEKNSDEIFAIQLEVAQKIAHELKAKISPDENILLRKVPTANSKAYDYYLRGKEYNVRFLHSGEQKDFENSLILQRQAIQLDTAFAKAYANIGLSYQWSELNYANPIRVDFLMVGERKWADSVFYYANRALQIDPNLPEAINLLGWHFGFAGSFEESFQYFNRSMQISQIHDNKGMGLLQMVKGDFEDAYLNFTKTYLTGGDLLPIDYTDVGLLYLHAGDLKKAEQYQLEALQLQPDFYWANRNLIYLLSIQNRLPEAWGYCQKLLLNSKSFEDYLNAAHVLALMKEYKKADTLLSKGLELMKNSLGDNGLEGAYIFWMNGKKAEGLKRFQRRLAYCQQAFDQKTVLYYKKAAYELAAINSFLGNQEESLKWLRDYAALGFRGGLENYILIDPLFDPVRQLPSFAQLMTQVNLTKATQRQSLLEKENRWPIFRQ